MKKTKLDNISTIPGNLIYDGDQFSKNIEVSIIDYNMKVCEHKKINKIPELKKQKKGFVRWIDFVGVDKVDAIQEIGDKFAIHQLTLEDIVNTKQRPKIEEIDDSYIFISMKMFSFQNNTNTLKQEQISIIITKDSVISFQEKKGDDFYQIKDRIEKGRGRVRKMNSDYLGYLIMDTIVDNYFLVMEQIEDEIESIQDEVLKDPKKNTLSKIQKLKQHLILLRKSIRPIREIVNTLQRTDSDLIDDNMGMYFRDLYDHSIQIIDTIETFRDIIAGSLDIYISSNSNRLNEVMKILTIISTIFIPLTFMVGVYGMNFKFMPELDKTRTYPTLWILMTTIAATMIIFFKRKKWI